jgi:hypothetical protein
MNRNRIVGHNLELEVVSALKACGYIHAVTSRAENRTRDAEKIDIINHDEARNGRLPYNIQCKNMSGPISYQKVLEEIETIEGIVNVVIHKKTEKVGAKFMPRGKFAFLHLKDFLSMVGDIEKQRVLINKLQLARVEEAKQPISI